MLPSRLFRCATLLLALTTAAAAQSPTAPAEAVLHRLMPRLAPQFHLTLHPSQPDAFHITGTPGNIHVDASTLPTLLYGVNWYLKYVAHLQVSTNGLQLGPVHLTLPAPPSPITQPALYKIRYALNENVDGYTAPYWSNDRWQHEIDILALSGTNAILIERGADIVLYQTFRDAGYSDLAIRRWITQPAHQNWQLMGNMCCFIEPISLDLLHRRAASAKRIIASLRALGITPVLPGYYGIVPADFATLHPGAHVITQGDWNGFTRPGWIDPRDPSFATLAANFYRHQQALFGDTSIYDMEIFQEGGTTGDVPPGPAAQLVQIRARDRPPQRPLVHDGLAEQPPPRRPRRPSTPPTSSSPTSNRAASPATTATSSSAAPAGSSAASGSSAAAPPSAPRSTTTPSASPPSPPSPAPTSSAPPSSPKASTPTPSPSTSTPRWPGTKTPVDLPTWTDAYALRRYGSPTHDDQPDPHAQRAWQILLHTAYGYRAGDGTAKGTGDADAPQGSLFNAQPSLTTTHAGTWAPHGAHYPLAALAARPHRTPPGRPLPPLHRNLPVRPRRRSPPGHGQRIPHHAPRRSTPPTNPATAKPSSPSPATGSAACSSSTTSSHQPVLPPRPLAKLRPPWSSSPAELKLLNYDARSILTTWGDRKASEAGLHEYANRDYAGLISTYYAPRWRLYFQSLLHSLDAQQSHSPDAQSPIDWYAFGDHWNRTQTTFTPNPTGNPYTAALAIANDLNLTPPPPHP